MSNSYKHQRRAQAKVVAIIIAVIIYLFVVASYDAFISTPKRNAKIEVVSTKFNDLKTYLDAKLPQIDSALFRHEILINDQNQQLEELNKLTGIIEESKKE